MKSRFSGGQEGAGTCIEVNRVDEDTLSITATMIPGQPTVLCTQEEWDKFVAGTKAGHFDELVKKTDFVEVTVS